MNTTPDQEKVLLGVIEYQEARRLRSLLEEQKILVELVSNPESCGGRGCKPTVEVYARSADLPVLKEFFQSQSAKLFAGLEFDASLFEEVFDPEKETARCPACGTEFSTQAKECPDCGLVFVAE